MKWQAAFVAWGCLGVASVPALAQPVDLPIPAATTDQYPAGISVRQLDGGPVYVDAKGRTLYGMDLRTLRRFSPDPAQYCQDACIENWEPVLAEGMRPNIAYPKGFGSRGRTEHRKKMEELGYHMEPQKAPDWTVIEGPQGPQWVYKGWHMVFTRKGEAPGSAMHDGEDELTWNTLKFVPPVPQIVAPPTVTTVFVDGAYALTDREGRILFTGKCRKDCGEWEPLSGGLASRGVGDWSISRAGDSAQWTRGGQPVFVGPDGKPGSLPKSASVLRPRG